MQLGRCPVCHSRIGLEAMIQDEAGRALSAMLAGLDQSLAMSLAGYLGLFRAENRDLANDRALRLAGEVLALADAPRLSAALAQTVEQLRGKGQIKNHNYLKRVLESVAEQAPGLVKHPGAVCQKSPARRPSYTADALRQLTED